MLTLSLGKIESITATNITNNVAINFIVS